MLTGEENQGITRRWWLIGFVALSLSACGGATGVTSNDDEPLTPANTATNGFDSGRTPQGAVLTGQVVRVVDGDTVRVLVDGATEDISVRLIGIDTPETVAPGKPVECFGPEATAFAEQQLSGQRVLIELDVSQGETDRFDRTLGYVWTEQDGALRLFNLDAVAEGFAIEYTYDDDYTWQQEFQQAQTEAARDGLGLWSAC
jgi:micrococcal nuclease